MTSLQKAGIKLSKRLLAIQLEALVEIKTDLKRGVIGQIIVGEYLFKKKFNANNVSLAILYHIGGELLEMFCREKGIRLI